MGSNNKTPVFLLKNPSEPSDRYEELILSADNGGYVPIFVPVLEHSILNEGVDEIAALLGGRTFSPSLPDRTYGGIIFTSQRAVAAFAEAIERVNSQSEQGISEFLDHTSTFYVVGQATQTALEALQLPCPIRGQHTGNGETLANFILQEYLEGRGSHDLLFMVGETRRDIIPRTLQSDSLPTERRIRVNEVEVYRSIENPVFPQTFQSEITKIGDIPRWVVVFSPTGCKSMLDILGLLDEGTSRYNESDPVSTRIATIGPTTRDHLIQEFGFPPQACAAKPTPDALLQAILNTK
jgi:uroporphyrinogen-III synthase